MNLIRYIDRDLMMLDLASKIAGELDETLLHEESASLAVPGGSTPGPLFDELSAADLDWSRVSVVLTDERRVPPDHDRSNERLLRERLLVGRAAAARFVRLVSDDAGRTAQPDEVAGILPLSVLLLGMGGDMHTASLFPGSPDLRAALASSAPSAMEVAAVDGLEPRVTLTAPVLKGAIRTHVLITGDDKRAAVERARHLPPSEAPISLVLGEANIHWAP